MQRLAMHDYKAAVCRLTPSMPAAIATIAVKGPQAVDAVLAVVRLKTPGLRPGRVHFGNVELYSRNAFQASELAVEQVVVCRTQDDEVELHCHGGQAVCNAMLEAFALQGCELIDSTHWTAGHVCPLAAAAETDLIQANTDKAAAVLIDQLGGALREQIDSISTSIRRQRFSAAFHDLEALAEWSELGLHLTQPWKVVLAGPPNVGKSSLMNAIVGQTKSIVHHEPGTTRDWIEAEVALQGWPVSLTDTAGIRQSHDSVEGEGVRRSTEQVLAADLIVLVIDAHVGWTQTHADLLALEKTRVMVAWNKADLGIAPPKWLENNFDVVATSTFQELGLVALLNTLAKTLVPNEPSCGQAVPFRASQARRIQSALGYLRGQQSAAALNELEHLTTSWTEEPESP